MGGPNIEMPQPQSTAESSQEALDAWINSQPQIYEQESIYGPKYLQQQIEAAQTSAPAMADLYQQIQNQYRPAMAEQDLAFAQEYNPQFAQTEMDLQKQLAPQMAELINQQRDLLNPQRGAVNQQLGQNILQQLQSAGGISPELRDKYTQELRKAQASRGVYQSPSSAVEEGRQLSDIAARNYQEAIKNAMGYTASTQADVGITPYQAPQYANAGVNPMAMPETTGFLNELMGMQGQTNALRQQSNQWNADYRASQPGGLETAMGIMGGMGSLFGGFRGMFK